MATVFGFLFRVFLLAAGLVFAASLAVVFVAVLVVWLLRSGWARLTGKTVSPFVVRMRPAQGFARMYPRPAPQGAQPAPFGRGGRLGDVTDVEPK